MSTIRVVSGVAAAPTAMAAYDAALAEAGVHNYNLVPVSSVVPADAEVASVGTAPDLGPAGNRLTVVEAAAVTDGTDPVSAGLGWATGPGPGLFYEASGTDPDEVRATVAAGLDAGRDLRDWEFTDETIEVRTAGGSVGADGADADANAPHADGGTTDGARPNAYAAAVVVAAYGRSEPIL